MRILGTAVVAFSLALAASCEPSWDGEVDVYGGYEGGEEGEGEGEGEGEADDASTAKKIRDESAEEIRFVPCRVLADERCVHTFGDCGGELVDKALYTDQFDCAESERFRSCEANPDKSPPPAFHRLLAKRCFEELDAADGCDAQAELLAGCDDELWEDTTCTQTVGEGSTKLTLPVEGAEFAWGGPYASVCVEVDADVERPLTVRTVAAGGEKLDTLLFVYGPGGEELDVNDDDPDRDGLFSRVSFEALADSGTYTVVVAGYGAEDTGRVVLEVELGD